MDKKIDKAMEIINGQNIPAREKKIVGRNNGLYERTSNSKILITEDNKLMLND